MTVNERVWISTYVIIGTSPDGYEKFGARNVQERDRVAVVAEYERIGWRNVRAIVERF